MSERSGERPAVRIRRRALIVDDDRAMVRSLTDVLRLKGWDVTGAYTGADAVAAASGSQFDVVLMDIKMPGMDGVSAFKAMKAERPDVRVVLMTAYAAQELVSEAQNEGVVRVMSKPVDLSALLSLLAASMSRQHPVLLVDTDSSFLKSLAEVLRLRGFDTVIAIGLEEATKLITEKRPAAVLLHLTMGSAGVREAIEAIQAVGPSTAIIVYSGRPEAIAVADRALPAKAVHAFLQKPFAVDQLTGVLDALGHNG